MTLGFVDRIGVAALRRETLGGVMERLQRIHGGRRIVHQHRDDHEMTYTDAARLVRSWANAIGAQIERGDPVVIATPNGYDQFLLSIAASRAGGPARTGERPDELR